MCREVKCLTKAIIIYRCISGRLSVCVCAIFHCITVTVTGTSCLLFLILLLQLPFALIRAPLSRLCLAPFGPIMKSYSVTLRLPHPLTHILYHFLCHLLFSFPTLVSLCLCNLFAISSAVFLFFLFPASAFCLLLSKFSSWLPQFSH